MGNGTVCQTAQVSRKVESSGVPQAGRLRGIGPRRCRAQFCAVVTGLLILRASFVFSATPQEPVIDLEARIAEVLSAIGAEAGIYFESAEGRVFLWNADESFHAASTMKVPVMMEVFHQAHEKQFSLNDQIKITAHEERTVLVPAETLRIRPFPESAM